MNLNHFTLLSTWSTASGAEFLLLRHLALLKASSLSLGSMDAFNRATELQRLSGGLDLSNGGGSCSRQLETFSGLMKTPR